MQFTKQAAFLISINLILFTLVIILLLITPITGVLNLLIRFCALVGFTSMFIATTMTPFMAQLYKIFGRPFVKQHHVYSILGLVLITVHPVAYAISVANILVFIPIFYPWIDFWTLAGRPALILIYMAVLAAILRRKIKKKWRVFHFLNYIALFFGYVHGILIGTDFTNLGILIIFTIMIIVSFATFGLKRLKTYNRRKKIK